MQTANSYSYIFETECHSYLHRLISSESLRAKGGSNVLTSQKKSRPGHIQLNQNVLLKIHSYDCTRYGGIHSTLAFIPLPECFLPLLCFGTGLRLGQGLNDLALVIHELKGGRPFGSHHHHDPGLAFRICQDYGR
jgi:hypothetical protein